MKTPPKFAFLASVALIAIILPLSSCAKKEEAKKEEVQKLQFDANSRLVIAQNNISDLKPIAGIYTSDDDSQARARIGGTLVSLNVDEGQNVAQGQVIGVIDEARFGAEVQAGQANAQAAMSGAQAASAQAMQAPANLEAAQAMANKATADYNRTKMLYDQGVYAKARLDQMQAALTSANAQVHAASAGINAANAQANAARSQAGAASAQARVAQAVRAQGRILAPKSGKITMVPVSRGSVVMPGEIVAYISSGNPVLRIRAPEADAKLLKVGQAVSLMGANGEITGQSTITKIYPLVENGQVKIDLSTDGAEHLVGERVDIALPIGNRNAIIIPKHYIITRDGFDFVMLLKNNQALEVPIQRGQFVASSAIPDGVEVLSGLEINDVIVAKAK